MALGAGSKHAFLFVWRLSQSLSPGKARWSGRISWSGKRPHRSKSNSFSEELCEPCGL